MPRWPSWHSLRSADVTSVRAVHGLARSGPCQSLRSTQWTPSMCAWGGKPMIFIRYRRNLRPYKGRDSDNHLCDCKPTSPGWKHGQCRKRSVHDWACRSFFPKVTNDLSKQVGKKHKFPWFYYLFLRRKSETWSVNRYNFVPTCKREKHRQNSMEDAIKSLLRQAPAACLSITSRPAPSCPRWWGEACANHD